MFLRKAASVAFIAALAVSMGFAQGATKRLILKNGDYQVATKWEIQGDRVRYYSAERYGWEEIPKELVDWAATDKWNNERAAGNVSATGREISEEEKRERDLQASQTPVVSPGINLPASGGVFLLDVYQNQPQLAELVQSGGEVNKNVAGNILRATLNPFASNKRTIELKGVAARVQSHVPNPFLYLNIDLDQEEGNNISPENAAKRFRIVKLTANPKKKTRVLSTITRKIYGKTKQEQQWVNVDAEVVGEGPWIKLTPVEALQPGEYAIVEMLDKEMNIYVWDFGVNPTAPANPSAWKPQAPKPNLTGVDKPAVLIKPEKN